MERGATITVLAVSSSAEDRASLTAIFTHSRWWLFQATSAAEAISFLDANPMPVVICDADLPDGTWRTLRVHASSLPDPPLLIVASHLADDQLWTEALSSGAHGVLAKPFRAREVFQSVSLAWRRWKDLSESACSAAVA